MLTKFNDSNDMNTIASDAIHSYIKDGYHIDAKESVIDREKDKDCTFKAVLKKDVDGINCKTVIKLTDNGDDKNKHCAYHKVETVGDTKWSEETRTFSCTTDKTKLNSAVKNHVLDNICKTPRMWWNNADDDFYDYYHDTVRNIFKDFSLHCDWFGDKLSDRQKRLADVIKAPNDDRIKVAKPDCSNTDKKDTRWTCKCPSAYQRLDDYIKLNNDNDNSNNDEKEHIKVGAKDSEDDIYNKIVNRKKNLEEACNAKARADKKKVPIESLIEKDDNKKDECEDDLEDSLIKLVRYIFGK